MTMIEVYLMFQKKVFCILRRKILLGLHIPHPSQPNSISIRPFHYRLVFGFVAYLVCTLAQTFKVTYILGSISS